MWALASCGIFSTIFSRDSRYSYVLPTSGLRRARSWNVRLRSAMRSGEPWAVVIWRRRRREGLPVSSQAGGSLGRSAATVHETHTADLMVVRRKDRILPPALHDVV